MALPVTADRQRPPPARPLLSPGWMYVSHVVWGAFAGVTGVLTYSAETGLSAFWILHGVMFIDLAMSMDREPGSPIPPLWAVAATSLTCFMIGGTLAGGHPLALLWLGLGSLVVALLGLKVYRFRGIGGSWVPRDGREALWLLLSLALACVVGDVIGAYPGTGLLWDHGVDHRLWAGAQAYNALAIAATCATPFYFSNEDALVVRGQGRRMLAYVPLAVACVVIPAAFPDRPLSWLYVLPALSAAMVLTRRWVAAYYFPVMVVATFVPAVSLSTPTLATDLLPQTIVALTFAFMSFLAILIVVLRDENARLARHVEQLADADRGRNELFTAVIQSMSDAMVLADPDGQVALTNRAADALSEQGIPDRLDAAWAQTAAWQATDAERVAREVLLTRMLRPPEDRLQRLDVTAPGTDGDRHLAVSSKLVRSGATPLTLLMIRDTTAAHRRHQELESFAGTVAHDLKGPLTSLLGWVEAASDELAEQDPQAGRHALTRAHQAVRRMHALIDDYLAYAVSRGGTLHVTDVDLREVVMELVAVYSDAGPLAPSFDVLVDHVVRADASLTRQLMANLIGNGIKYSREGEAPYIQVASLDHEPGWAEVSVADRGRGIQLGDEEKIFGRLNRSDKDASAVRGIGLGLSLCHAIVTRHGGTIHAENNEWGGATIRFTLPAGEVAASGELVAS